MSPPLFNLHSKDAFGRNGGWNKKQSPSSPTIRREEPLPEGKVMHAMTSAASKLKRRPEELGRSKGKGADGSGFFFQYKDRWAECWSNKRKAVIDLDKEMKGEDIL